MNGSEKLKHYIIERQINAQHLVFEVSCHSVTEAAAVVGARAEDFVKNICMIDESGTVSGVIVAIVKGEDKASRKRVAKALNIPMPRLANGDEIVALTGYEFGGTPSFGFEATFLIDPRVLETPAVYTGGGGKNSLMHVSTGELCRVNGGQVVRIRS